MSKITYANKVALNENSDIADINKVKADDMNEIKTCVNNNDDMLTGGAVAGDMVVNSIRTKNILDINNVLVGQLLSTAGSGGTSANALWNSTYFIAVKPNTTYTYTTVNPSTTTNQIIINQYNGTTLVTGSQYNKDGGGTWGYAFTTGSTTTNVRLGYRNDRNYQNLQLEEGSTTTTYSPYQNLTNDNSLIPIWTGNVYATNTSTSIPQLVEGNLYAFEVLANSSAYKEFVFFRALSSTQYIQHTTYDGTTAVRWRINISGNAFVLDNASVNMSSNTAVTALYKLS